MSDYEQQLDAIESATESTVEVLSNIETSLKKVEVVVANTRSHFASIWWLVFLALGWFILKDIWYSKWRYGLAYSVDGSKVSIQPHPHDCNFLAAPLGAKYCDYERKVIAVQWWNSSTKGPMASLDGGKTWTQFTPDPSDVLPVHAQVVMVNVTWEKIAE